MSRRALAVLALALAIALLAVGASLLESRPAASSDWVQAGDMLVRIDQIEIVTSEPGRLMVMPPTFVQNYPIVLNAWLWLFRERVHVQDGLEWVVITGRIRNDGRPLSERDFDVLTDCGEFTMGTIETGYSDKAGTADITFSARSEITAGLPVRGAVIELDGQEYRISFPVR